ncbi:MAG: Uncharacterised protein [Flavobacterium sp. SCGC AAA160-P02]|nr:MAG: Uncharacterised protein [Flavobacterium sp. SCGC AAA160-P02]|tara:strand:+ start:265 stop:618 length:354 start_codon:yes stop_codon:yes gene_type:complete
MCNHIKTIAKGKSGELTVCTNCHHYHLTFNNIFFDFTKKEFFQFKKYIFQLDTEYWNENYPCTKVKRNIPVPTLQENLVLLFNQQEIEELKNLFSSQFYQQYQRINAEEIDYLLIDN